MKTLSDSKSQLTFKIQTKVSKPLAEVFDAVYNPKKLSGYFTNGGASAPLNEGTTVEWAFEDTPGERMAFPVIVKKMVPNKTIVFNWEANDGEFDPKTGKFPEGTGYLTTVEMNFEAISPNVTLVSIVESGWRETPQGQKASYQNCSGWMHMSLCLKAYLEHGIDLRKGSF